MTRVQALDLASIVATTSSFPELEAATAELETPYAGVDLGALAANAR